MDNHKLGILYAEKEKYIRELDSSKPDFQRLLIETVEWKIPNLMQVVPGSYQPASVAEVGCFTGHLIGNLLINGKKDFKKYGYDVNPDAINTAKLLYPDIDFSHEDIFRSNLRFDLVILSDILEHIENEEDFLSRCQTISNRILLNLPLEKSLATINRKYGFDDPSGHLRAYNLRDAEKLIRRAGYRILKEQVICAAKSPIAVKNKELSGSTTDSSLASKLKWTVKKSATYVPGLSSFLYGANLFAFLEPM